MSYSELADLIFPEVKCVSYYEEKYPKRNLDQGAEVTRFAPSPTGFIHLGGLFGSTIDKKIASQSNGICILRIEDTDQKREVEDGTIQIINSLKEFNIEFDEGPISETEQIGNYGPYKQSERKDIYQAYAKHLIKNELAYPCFATPEELEQMRHNQEKAKIRPGYYGIWAQYRNLPIPEAIERIKKGEKYIIRFKSWGNENRKIKHHDLIKGNIEFPENDQDIVIIKADGLPTYHFAHVVDDHLMGTTIVIRGEEWVSSIPLHLQLFQALEFKPPKYAHTATIMKEDNGGKRKLSKRKDPEAAISYYSMIGVPVEAVNEYLLNLINSNFENWRKSNKDKSVDEFKIELNKMSISGALFDMVKLLDISKNMISKYSSEKVYKQALCWAEKYDLELANMLQDDKPYALKVLGIERGNIKPRKDISKWSDIKETINYMYKEKFNTESINYEFQKINNKDEIKKILNMYLDQYYNPNDNKETWFNKIKDLTEQLGDYAREVKDFKKEPTKYKGHVGDISMVLRIALTGRQNTPDMYEIMQVLGKDQIEERFKKCIKSI